MRIHIPKHFERFEVISQLKELLTEYAKGGITNDGENSFESYFYQNSLDPVKKFLMLCIPKDKIGEADYDTVINYYTSKFLLMFQFLSRIFTLFNTSHLH